MKKRRISRDILRTIVLSLATVTLYFVVVCGIMCVINHKVLESCNKVCEKICDIICPIALGSLIGIGITFLVTCFLKKITYCMVKNKCAIKNSENKKYWIYKKIDKYKHCFLKILSWDYAWTDLAKQFVINSWHKEKSNERKCDSLCNESYQNLEYLRREEASYAKSKYIIYNNNANLLISFVVCVLAALLLCHYNSETQLLSYIAFSLQFARMLSRTMEINCAFLIDVFDGNKSSGLQGGERIKLALKSLLEEVLLFGTIYAMLAVFFAISTNNGDTNVCSYFLKGFKSLTFETFDDETILIVIISIYQTVSAAILITLSIATYVSGSKRETKLQEDGVIIDKSDGITYLVNDDDIHIVEVPYGVKCLDFRKIKEDVDDKYARRVQTKDGNKKWHLNRNHSKIYLNDDAILDMNSIKNIYIANECDVDSFKPLANKLSSKAIYFHSGNETVNAILGECNKK